MENKSFEGAQKRIEEIIESIDRFKEAAELLKFCDKELKEVEMSIQKIVDKDGKIKFEEFE